jgi:hypothetical protein
LTGTGQSVSNLAVSEMSGASDDWDKYVEFLGGYSGYLTYRLPGDVPSSSVADIEVRLNYRGSAPTTQTWTFGLFNWKRKAWTVLYQERPEWETGRRWSGPGWRRVRLHPPVGTIHLARE